MFTGIITNIGTIISIEKYGDIKAVIKTSYDMDSIAIGASIACSGVCLTVVQKGNAAAKQSKPNDFPDGEGIFSVDISAETVSRTNIGNWREGGRVNLERAMRLGDEFGGHIVSGHVDGLAEIVDISGNGDSHILTFKAPENLAMFIAEKGSVTLDGISLTVNEVYGNNFKVNIIPHTWENTTIKYLSTGSKVNLEIDMLARYVSRILEYKGS